MFNKSVSNEKRRDNKLQFLQVEPYYADCRVAVVSQRRFQIHFPIHARSSQATIPSTTARNVVAIKSERMLNRQGRFIQGNAESAANAGTRNQ